MKLRICTMLLFLAACGSDEASAPEPPAGSGVTEVPGRPEADAASGIQVGARLQRPPTALVPTHEELLADLAAPRHPSDGGGRAWLEEGPTEVVANGRGRWSFLYEVGPEGIDALGGEGRGPATR